MCAVVVNVNHLTVQRVIILCDQFGLSMIVIGLITCRKSTTIVHGSDTTVRFRHGETVKYPGQTQSKINSNK